MSKMMIDATVKEEITQAFLKAEHPAGLNGTYYTDGTEVWFREAMAQWDPWPDGREVVNVQRLFDYAEIGVDESCYENEDAEENAELFFRPYLADAYVVDDEGFAQPLDV